MYLVSACLLGENCKYNGKNNLNIKLMEFLKDQEYIAFCPEVMGGLPTPRIPAERLGQKVFNQSGEDVTKQLQKGALQTLELAKKYQPKLIILKAKSPSCGIGKIYDGTFRSKLIDGNGLTAEILLKNGFNIADEDFI